MRHLSSEHHHTKHLSWLCQLSFRCKVGAKDIICTCWQRLSDVIYRHLGRRAGPFVTIVDNIITELDITLRYHYTLERDFSLTVDDTFNEYSLFLEIHRARKSSLTALISHFASNSGKV